MGVCNSCDKENDVDREKAAQKAVETRIKQIETNSVGSNAFCTPPASVDYSRSPYIDTQSTTTTLRSFQYPQDSRPSESARTSEVEKFHFGPAEGEPGVRPQSGVFKIPNQFSPLSSESPPPEDQVTCEAMNWSVAEVVSWWCDKLPDEAIQYAPLVEDTQLRGEDLLAMDLELLMSFQIDRPLAESILMEIHKLMKRDIKISHSRNVTVLSTSTTVSNGRETSSTQVFSEPENDSVPSYWKAPGVPEETDEECEEYRSPLTLLPPNSPRMQAEVESHRIAQLEKQIKELQEQLTMQQRPASPVGKRINSGKSGTHAEKRASPRGVAKGRRTKKVNSSGKRRSQGKFAVYKEGPIEIGRIENWSPARYSVEDDGREFLDERLSHKISEQKYHVAKLGPRDMGKVSGWKPYRHNREDSGRDWLAPRLKKVKPVLRPPERKEGPRGAPLVFRKRSSLIKRDGVKEKSTGRRSASCKNSDKTRGGRKNSGRSASRKASEKRSASRDNGRKSYREARSSSRKRSSPRQSLSTPDISNFTSGDFRLLKMSADRGGAAVPYS